MTSTNTKINISSLAHEKTSERTKEKKTLSNERQVQ